MFAVIYCSAGCLPDNDDVEFIGTLTECEDWVDAHAEEYARPDVLHDLYGLEVIDAIW